MLPLDKIKRSFTQEVKYELIKESVLKHGDIVCGYCGEKVAAIDVEFDHIIPAALGGLSIKSNAILACKSCNQLKKDKDLKDFLLMKVPSQICIGCPHLVEGKEICLKNRLVYRVKQCIHKILLRSK